MEKCSLKEKIKALCPIHLRKWIFLDTNSCCLGQTHKKDSPIGTSPLNSVYTAWRFKTQLEMYESTSIAQDLRGLKVIKIPTTLFI